MCACSNTSTDGIYCPVDGSMKPLQMAFTWWPAIQTRGRAPPTKSFSSHLPQYVQLTNMFPGWKYVIRLYIVHPYTGGGCAFDTSVTALICLKTSFQPAGKWGNERPLMCITSLLHYVLYYIYVTHAFVPPYLYLRLCYTIYRFALYLHFFVVRCASHWPCTVLVHIHFL